MTLTWSGFDGTFPEKELARTFAEAGQFYGAPINSVTQQVDHTALQVTKTGAARTIAVSPGTAFGHGVRATEDSGGSWTLDAVASGNERVDLLCLRRKWDITNGSVEWIIHKGVVTPSAGSGAPMVYPAARKTTRGIEDDQPIALVKVSSSGLLTIEDHRVFPAKDMVASTLVAVPKVVGSRAYIGGVQWLCVLVGSTPTWVRPNDPDWSNLTLLNGVMAQGGSRVQYRVVNGMVELRGSVQKTDGSDFNMPAAIFASLPFTLEQPAFFKSEYHGADNIGRGYSIVIQPDGKLLKQAFAPNVFVMRLDGIRFPLR